MRSLRYLLTGRAANVDDLLHLLDRKQPGRVRIDLSARSFVTDETVITELTALYDWRLPGSHGTCEQICGTLLAWNGPETKRRHVAAANARLQRSLERIQECRMEIAGASRRFRETQ